MAYCLYFFYSQLITTDWEELSPEFQRGGKTVAFCKRLDRQTWVFPKVARARALAGARARGRAGGRARAQAGRRANARARGRAGARAGGRARGRAGGRAGIWVPWCLFHSGYEHRICPWPCRKF